MVKTYSKGNIIKKVEEYLGIAIDYGRDSSLTEKAKKMLTAKGFYKKSHEDSPQQTLARAATCYSFGDYYLAQRIYDYASQGYFTFSSPVLSNAVDINWPSFSSKEFEVAGDWLQENVEPDGLPISCFLTYIGDNKRSLVEGRKETAWLSMMGGGVGINVANRSPDEKSTGVMAHLKGYDADALAYKQTASRRGSIAAYLDIDHPEIKSFISCRNPVGGDTNKKCFNLNNAVNLPDDFMRKAINGEKYELVDPKHGPTGNFLNAREVLEEINDQRFETGEPYIMFKDTVNRAIPKWITKPTYHVSQSNLCAEVVLMTSEKRTAVCCLSSVNLEKYSEWKNTTLVEDLVRLLDNVLEYFIRLAPPELSRAVHSASQERAIGIGSLGFHSFLQKNNIPFESGGFDSASQWSYTLSKEIYDAAINSSKKLAKERGEPEDCLGSGMRNSHLIAIAPNASSSEFVGASPSIEPWSSNAINTEGRAGSHLVKNPHLVAALKDLGKDTEEMWDSIIAHAGSVQHRKDLPDELKKVYKTASEIDPMWIVELAAIRQPNICQSQSLNIFVTPTITKQKMMDVVISAWKKGVKTLYYCRAEQSVQPQVGKGTKEPLNAVPVETSFETCLGCEG